MSTLPKMRLPQSMSGSETRKVPQGHFTAGIRGDLEKALSSKKAMQEIRPQGALPVSWMHNVRFHGDLTARDAAAFGLAMSMSRASGEKEVAIEREALARYVGVSHRVRLNDIVDRLNNASCSFEIRDGRVREWARYMPFVCVSHRRKGEQEDVIFSFPPQIERVLSAPSHYEYKELAAMPTMKSRWSDQVYSRLLAWIHDQEISRIHGGKRVWEVDPVEFAEQIGWPSAADFDFADFRKVVLEPAIRDLKVLRKLKVKLDYLRASGRGRRVRALAFEVKVLPAEAYEVKARPLVEGDMQAMLLCRDDPRFRVSAGLFARAMALCGGHNAYWLRGCWEVAVQRALSRVEVEVPGRRVRGKNLLDMIEAGTPADDVAWKFFQEEAADPDLLKRDSGNRIQIWERVAAGQSARKRVSAARKEEPIDLSVPADPYQEPPKPRSLTDEEYPADLREWAEHGPYDSLTRLLHGYATDEWLMPEIRLAAVARILKARSVGGEIRDYDAVDAVSKLCCISRFDLMEEGDAEPGATASSPQVEATIEEDHHEWAWSEPVAEEPVDEQAAQPATSKPEGLTLVLAPVLKLPTCSLTRSSRSA